MSKKKNIEDDILIFQEVSANGPIRLDGIALATGVPNERCQRSIQRLSRAQRIFHAKGWKATNLGKTWLETVVAITPEVVQSVGEP